MNVRRRIEAILPLLVGLSFFSPLVLGKKMRFLRVAPLERMVLASSKQDNKPFHLCA
jgi:hypothetical protein